MYCDIPVLDRCCFCLPLRKGILIFGYINIVFCTLMVGIYSFSVHHKAWIFTLYHGTSDVASREAVIILYAVEIIFTAILIYGSHKQLVWPVKIFYYFSIYTFFGGIMMQIVDVSLNANPYYLIGFVMEFLPLLLCSTVLQLYLILMIRSMVMRLERGSGPHTYENQLEQIVFEGKTEQNGSIYNNTSTPVAEN